MRAGIVAPARLVVLLMVKVSVFVGTVPPRILVVVLVICLMMVVVVVAG